MFVIGYGDEFHGYQVDRFFETEEDFDKWVAEIEIEDEFIDDITLYKVDTDKLYYLSFGLCIKPFKSVSYFEEVSYILAKRVYNEVYGYCNYFPTTDSLVLNLTRKEQQAKVFNTRADIPKWYREYGYRVVETIVNSGIETKYL